MSLSILIGLMLGLLGGGGSILTVPMLVYLLHVEPKQAILTSFVVVGISSLIALLSHARRGTVCWKSGGVFGIAGMAGAFGGGHLAGHFSAQLLMTLFGLVVAITGIFMLKGEKIASKTNVDSQKPLPICPLNLPFLRVLFDGFFVGGLTGMVGVGGGFLIMPALTLLIGLPIQGAVGTSLLVIVMNAMAGLIGYSQHVSLDLNLTLIVASGAIMGSTGGAWLSGYVNPVWLRRLFGVLVLLVAAYTLFQSLSLSILESLCVLITDVQSLEWAMLAVLLFGVLVRIAYSIHRTAPLGLPSYSDAAKED
ncbi:sulfite exporter TauE/SafE family protein [Methylomonas sp. AM2-LC]|uniref:sulfite exporter TauE/SafE family protein n=1 Tax=Methylomonas sp. AM2-LC TaxID=3153301 RepID=UPI00326524A6